MNNCKCVNRRDRRFKSMANHLKAVILNQGMMLVNKLALGDSVLVEGQILHSPGGTFAYQVIGPCCRLYDREQLPWPSCSINWLGKQPSWRRVGRRFILDVGTKNHPTYVVRLLGQESTAEPILLTLYSIDLSTAEKEWWHGRKPGSVGASVQQNLGQPATPEAQPTGLSAGMA